MTGSPTLMWRPDCLDDVVVEFVGVLEDDVRLDVGVLVVVDEKREVVTVTRHVLDVGVVHQRVDAAEAAKPPGEVVEELIEGMHVHVDAVLRQQGLQFRGEHRLVGRAAVVPIEQRVADILQHPITERRLDGVQVGLHRVVAVLALLVVAGDHDVREGGVHPVAVEFLVTGWHVETRERSVLARPERTDVEGRSPEHLVRPDEPSTEAVERLVVPRRRVLGHRSWALCEAVT